MPTFYRSLLKLGVKKIDVFSVCSPMGVKFGYKKGDFPVTEDISNRLLRLPFYNTLRMEELDEVCKAISEFKIK